MPHPKHRITPVMAETLGRCPRRFEIEFERSLRRAGRQQYPWPLTVGEAVRRALTERDAKLAAGATHPQAVRDAAMRGVAKYLDDARRSSQPRTPQEAKHVELAIAGVARRAHEILDHYGDKHDSDVIAPVAPGAISAGIPFRIKRRKEQIVGAVHEEAIPAWSRGRPGRRGRFRYAARLDRVQRIQENNVLVMRVLSARSVDLLDDVVAGAAWWVGHVWLAQQLIGAELDFVLFDYVRTKAPSLPATTKCRQCGGQGTLEKGTLEPDGTWTPAECVACNGTGVGGISRAPCDTVPEAYYRLATQYTHLGPRELDRHKEQIDKLRHPERFCSRRLVTVQQAHVTAWLRDAAATAQQIAAYRRARYWPRNPWACEVRGLRCPYEIACNSPSPGEDAPYYQGVDFRYPGIEPEV